MPSIKAGVNKKLFPVAKTYSTHTNVQRHVLLSREHIWKFLEKTSTRESSIQLVQYWHAVQSLLRDGSFANQVVLK